MKQSFLLASCAMFAPAATTENATGTVTNDKKADAKPEPTSAKLTELKAQLAEKWAAMQSAAFGTQEAIDAYGEVFKVQGLIKAEIAEISKLENEAKLAVLRSERVKLRENYRNAVVINETVKADKKSTQEQKDAAQLAEQTAQDVLDNELLAKYAKSAPAATGGGDKPAGERGATGKAIHELLTDFIAGGMTATEAVKATIEKGYSRGTVGSVRTEMVKAGEIKE